MMTQHHKKRNSKILLCSWMKFCNIFVLSLFWSVVIKAFCFPLTPKLLHQQQNLVISPSPSLTNFKFTQLNMLGNKIDEKFQPPLLPMSLGSSHSNEVPLIFWRGMVLFVCVIWSTNFAVIKEIQDQNVPGLDPSLYAAVRFTLAALVLLPRTLGHWNNSDMLKGSLFVGMCKFLGYYGQSLGMQTSSADKSAFICSMNVVWVSLVSGIVQQKFRLQTWISVVLAVIGVAYLELEGSTEPVLEDLWLFLQPIGFGSSYLLLERLLGANSNNNNNNNNSKQPIVPGALTAFSVCTVAVTSILWAISEGHTPADIGPIFDSPVAMGCLLYTGIVTTAGAIWLQSIAFKNVPATDASIILTTEPIFAAIFALGLLGESISTNDVIGGLLVISACLSNELNFADKIVGYLRTRYKSYGWGRIGGDPDA